MRGTGHIPTATEHPFARCSFATFKHFCRWMVRNFHLVSDWLLFLSPIGREAYLSVLTLFKVSWFTRSYFNGCRYFQ